MNIDVEISFKIRASDQSPQGEPRQPVLAVILHKIASHPCVVMILREIMRSS